jgi:hypothetical protein
MPTFAANASLLKSLKQRSQRELAQFAKERVSNDMKTSAPLLHATPREHGSERDDPGKRQLSS